MTLKLGSEKGARGDTKKRNKGYVMLNVKPCCRERLRQIAEGHGETAVSMLHHLIHSCETPQEEKERMLKSKTMKRGT